MAQKSNIHKKTKNYLTFLRFLTRWLGNKKRNTKSIQIQIQKYEVENNILKRILSYLIGFPHIHWYCNKYLNNKFKFDTMDTEKLLFTLAYIMDFHKINDSKNFYFMKNNELKDDFRNQFKKIIKEYTHITKDIFYNDQDLNFLYELYLLGEINNTHLTEIDLLLNNKSTLKIPSDIVPNINIKTKIITDSINEQLSDNIIQFLCDLQNQKSNSCNKCPLFNRDMIPLDTNMTEFGDCDIIFIGSNPSYEEQQIGKPFVGSSGQELRNIIHKFPKSVKWVLTNFIMCQLDSKKDLQKSNKIENIQKNCEDFIREILTKFPAKYIVAVGNDAFKRFNITQQTITEVSGQIFNITEDTKMIPIIHPSSLLKSRNQYQGIFDKTANIIIDLFKNYKTLETQTIQHNSSIIEENNIDDNLTFFDVKEIENNKLLYIYIDQNGKKKYVIKDYYFEFYVKSNNWLSSKLIDNNMNYKVKISGNKKYYIIKQVREYLENIKRS